MGILTKMLSTMLLLLAIVLIATALYNMVAPLIPMGNIGMLVVGIILAFLVAWLGGKKLFTN